MCIRDSLKSEQMLVQLVVALKLNASIVELVAYQLESTASPL